MDDAQQPTAAPASGSTPAHHLQPDLITAAQTSRLDGLEALRDTLAIQIENTRSGRDLAALAARFTDVLAQIEELAGGTCVAGTVATVTAVDEFTDRRNRRRRTS